MNQNEDQIRSNPYSLDINNYKGVMLCSRPNQQAHQVKLRHFYNRVVPKQQLGLPPPKKQHLETLNKQKRTISKTELFKSVLSKHKQFLKKHSIQRKKKQQQLQAEAQRKIAQFWRIRRQCKQGRNQSKKMKNEYNHLSNNLMNILNEENQCKKVDLTKENLKKLNEQNEKKDFKKKKPVWAKTKQEIEQEEEQQVENLINYFNQDVDNYINDLEVKAIMKTLKGRIEQIKKHQNWKENEEKRIMEMEKKKQKKNQETRSVKSNVSQHKSISSQKSSKAIQELKQILNKDKKQWDKSTTIFNVRSTIEQKIAKHIADEILRNYKNLREVHSNVSIRKLIQQQAHSQLIKDGPNPKIIRIQNEKNQMDPSYLPYLHRNPAI